MTRAQIRKLESLLGKLEALENETTDARVREYLHRAKNELLTALRRAEPGE